MDSEDDVDGTLQSFMFGNIDESGHLENDIFDEESKQHLSSLSNFGLGSLVRELVDLEETNELSNSNEFQEKSENAIDYSDINEAVADADFDEGADAGHETVESSAEQTSVSQTRDSEQGKDEDVKPTKASSPPGDDDQSAKNGQNVHTPLAGMLPPELAHYNVRELFPDFSQDKVLRFQRLFRPTYEPVTYKIKKKKKPAGQTEPKQESSTTEAKMKTEGGSTGPVVDHTSPSAAEEGADVAQTSGEEPDDGMEDGMDMDWGGFSLKLGRSPRPEEVMTNDAVLLTRPSNISADSGNDGSANTGNQPEVPYWRHGPAKLWYDMMDVPENGEGFDYGFRRKPEESCEEEPTDLPAPPKFDYPLDTFVSVNLVHWEELSYYDPNDKDQRESLARLEKQKMPYGAWHPSTSLRTFEHFVKQMNPNLYSSLTDAGYFNRTFALPKPAKGMGSQATDSANKKLVYSVMPVESSELLYERWEDDIILDTQNMTKIPKPPDCAIDPYDENVVLEIPDDNDPTTPEQQEQETKKEKETKKSKAIQDKVGLLKDKINDDQEERDDTPIQNKDPWNLSESEIYLPKNSANQPISGNLGVSIIEHSTPAVELRMPFFPTHMTTAKLRYFHRPTLRRYQHGGHMASSTNAYPLLSLMKLIKRKEAQREMERIASGGGEMFFMRTPDDLTDNFYGAGKRRLETRVCGFGDIFFMRTTEDLTGKDGELILAEFSEQYPPLMNQVGMATKVKNYYKRKPGNDSDPPAYKYGEMAYAHTSRFLGSLLPGQCLQAFENNMYRAPSYEHRVPETDLLVIRNRTEFHAREVETIFVVGQECPLIEVPGPNSKRANNFVRDFLQVFIYRLFWKSRDVPRRIKMEEIRLAFPTHSENTIRKRLKQCADFKRTGVDSNWWVQNSNFRLPTEQEISQMVTPEQCCAYYAMLAAEQRLKDAGYGEKSLLQDEENDEETQTKMEDEVKAAPWNTTRAFIAAMKGRCLLDLNGVADPTGCGEGFSFVSVPNKPQQAKDDALAHTPVKRTVTGTDADLRRLPLKEAKQLLRKFGVPEDKIKKLSRWEVINLVRTESTKQSKASMEGFGNSAIGKFARGNRFSVAEHRERYKEECQRIFDLQNRMLGSDEVLSTDEESDSEVADYEEFGRNLETMLCDGKTSSQMKHLREEAGRKELNKMLRENAGKNDKNDKNDKKKNEEAKLADASKGQRILKITRTFRNESGGEFTRTEIVRNQQVCDRYIKIRQTKDPEQIKQFAVNEQQREEMRKEKRRIQEQLRRCKRMEDIKSGVVMPPPAKKRKKELNPDSVIKLAKIKCRACGQVGHMKTNRDCPMFNKFKSSALVGKVALSEEQEEQLTKSDLVDRDLIISEGTKIKVSRHLVEHTEQVKHQALVLKLPKLVSESKKRRRAGKEVQLDYLKKSNKMANRRRADPLVTLSSIFENIVKEMKDLPNAKIFHHPVSAKYVPDYYVHIKKPMDLQTIVNNIRSRKYFSREAFIVDVSLIVKNSEVYNGAKSGLTLIAQTMLDFCLQRVTEKEEKIMSLEKAINPMLDVDLVSFGYILSGIVELRMKTVEGSIPFQHPVNKKQCKDYYEVIEHPMDLSTLYKKAKENKYHSQEQFLRDVQLIVGNCEKYNGPNSTLSKTANRLLDACRDAMKEQEDTLRQLEKNILAVQEAAMEGVETESVVTATSFTGGDTESVAAHSAKGGHRGGASEIFDDREEHLLERDDGDNLSHDDEDPEDFERLMRMDEFVDVEDAPEENVQQTVDDDDQVEQDSLEQDLHMTPERSSDCDDDEEPDDMETRSPTPKHPKLSSSGSDSEADEDQSSQANAIEAELSQYAEQVQQSNAMYRFDENAQDFSYDAVYTTTVGDDENSFDPQAFFSELVQQDGVELNRDEMGDTEAENLGVDNVPEAVADINNDLEVSDSDDSTPELVTLEDDESDQDFNMGDFLNME